MRERTPMAFVFDFRPEKTMCPIGPATGQGRGTVAGTQSLSAAVTHGPATRITGISGLKRPSTPLAPPLACAAPACQYQRAFELPTVTGPLRVRSRGLREACSLCCKSRPAGPRMPGACAAGPGGGPGPGAASTWRGRSRTCRVCQWQLQVQVPHFQVDARTLWQCRHCRALIILKTPKLRTGRDPPCSCEYPHCQPSCH
jgi:hypothetical protein